MASIACILGDHPLHLWGLSSRARLERQLRAAGFTHAELVATLAGEPLYARFGYTVLERYDAPMPGGSGLAVVRMEKTFAADG